MILQGVSVCSGCALAPSFLLAQLPDFDLAERAAESVDETLHRIEAAFRAVTAELTEEQAAQVLKWRQWSYYKLMYKEID